MEKILTEELLSVLINSIPGRFGIYKVDHDAIYKIYNSTDIEAIIGCTPEEYTQIEKDPLLLVSERDRSIFMSQILKTAYDKDHPDQVNTSRMIFNQPDYIPVISHLRYLGYYEGLPTVIAVFTIDISKERQMIAEKELRIMYESAVLDTGLMVWEYDIKNHRNIVPRIGENTYTNRVGLNHIIENVPESLVQFIQDDYVDDFVNMYKKIDAGAPKADCNVWFKRVGSTRARFEHMVLTNVFDEEGKPIKAFGLGQNLTFQRKEEERYTAINRQFEEIMLDSEIAARLDVANNKLLATFSYNGDVLDKLNVKQADEYFEVIAEEIADTKIQRHFRHLFNCESLIKHYVNKETRLSMTFPTYNDKQQLVWIEITLIMNRNPVSERLEAITYNQDVTYEVKRKEILDHLNNYDLFHYIAILDLKAGNIEFISARSDVLVPLNITMDYEEFIERRCKDLIPEEDCAQYIKDTDPKRILEELEKNNEYVITFRQSYRGTNIRCQLRIVWMNKSLHTALLTSVDITASYAAEQKHIKEMEEALTKARQANEAKSQFLSRISHDIRTPMGIITNMTDFAIEDRHNEEKLLSDLEKIKTADHFLLSLINDILDISKIDAGSITLHEESYRFKDYMKGLEDLFIPLCEKKKIKFKINVTGDYCESIMIDPTRINQITLNLISNAMKYTPEGGSITYTIDVEDLGNQIKVTNIITDTGVGMSESFQKIMFEPFAQEKSNPYRDTHNVGTGLGLPIVKRLITVMDGSINVRSAPGKGTTVTWTALFEKSMSHKNEEPKKVHQVSLKGHVLLVEDNELNREIMKRLLESRGVDVDQAVNGVEAVKMAIDHNYDLIFMDIQMPVMDGYKATDGIRHLAKKSARTVPIIALTADAFSEAYRRSLEVGMNDHLTKPINVDKLDHILQTYLKGV